MALWPAIDDYIAGAVGDQDTPVPAGTYRWAGSSLCAVTRPSTGGPYGGFAHVYAQDGPGSVIIDGLQGAFGFESPSPARILLRGINVINGMTTLHQPMVYGFWCDFQHDSLTWAKAQSPRFKIITINTTAGSNVVTAAAGTFSGSHVGDYLQCNAAHLGQDNQRSPSIATISATGNQVTLTGTNATAGSTHTGIQAYVGGDPTNGLYPQNRVLELNSPNINDVRLVNCDIHNASSNFKASQYKDLLLQGTKCYDGDNQTFDPTDRMHGDGMSLTGSGGADGFSALDVYLRGRFISEDSPVANSGSQARGPIKNITVDRFWHDYGGIADGFQFNAKADPRWAAGGGIFGSIDHYRGWTSNTAPTHRVEGVFTPTAGSPLGTDSVPAPGVTAQYTYPNINKQPTRLNVVEKSVSRGAAPSADPFNDPANPANLHRVAFPYAAFKDYFGWTDTTKPPSTPFVHPDAFQAVASGTSISATCAATTPVGAALVVGVACADTTAVISAPAGWDVVDFAPVAGAHHVLYRFMRNAPAAGGIETLGPFTSTASKLALAGCAVRNAGPNPLGWDAVNAGNPVNSGGTAPPWGGAFGFAPGTFSTDVWTANMKTVAIQQQIAAAGFKRHRHDISIDQVPGWDPANPDTTGDFTRMDAEFGYAIAAGVKNVVLCLSRYQPYTLQPGPLNTHTDGGYYPDVTLTGAGGVKIVNLWAKRVLDHYLARWGAGVHVDVEIFNESNVMKDASGNSNPVIICAVTAAMGQYIRTNYPSVGVLLSASAPGPSNNILATYGSDLFNFGGSGTTRIAPLDMAKIIGLGLGNCHAFGNPIPYLTGWCWHGYQSGGDSFNKPPARGATWPTMPTHFPIEMAYCHLNDIMEASQYFRLGGLPDAAQLVHVTEWGSCNCDYWDPVTSWPLGAIVCLTPQRRGDGSWNNTTRSWNKGARKLYQSQVANNVGVVPGTDVTKWVDVTGLSWGNTTDIMEPDELGHAIDACSDFFMGVRPDDYGRYLTVNGVAGAQSIFAGAYLFQPLDDADQGPDGDNTVPTRYARDRFGTINFKLVAKGSSSGDINGDGTNHINGGAAHYAAIATKPDTRNGAVGGQNRYQTPVIVTPDELNGLGLVFGACDAAGAFIFGQDQGFVFVAGESPAANNPGIVLYKKENLPKRQFVSGPSFEIEPPEPCSGASASIIGSDFVNERPAVNEMSIGALTL